MTMLTDARLLDGFVARGDEAAFEAILDRHGPMVWRVCRDILRDPHDAEDAFQATFLILVRSARGIRSGDSLGRWLYETAHKVALRAKVRANRHDVRSLPNPEMAPARPEADAMETREVRPLLHDEIGRLPEELRSAIILCYFEGLTQEDAARRLGCPLRTFKGWLARGRERLRGRLARRGVSVSALLLLVLLDEQADAVPEPLLRSTRNAGALAMARGSLPATIPLAVARLVRDTGRIGRRRRMMAVAAAVLVPLLIAGSGLSALRAATPSSEPAHPELAAVGDSGTHSCEPDFSVRSLRSTIGRPPAR